MSVLLYWRYDQTYDEDKCVIEPFRIFRGMAHVPIDVREDAVAAPQSYFGHQNSLIDH